MPDLPARLPPKQHFGRFKPGFIQQRRVQLQKYIDDIKHHPGIVNSSEFRNFLIPVKYHIFVLIFEVMSIKSIIHSLICEFCVCVSFRCRSIRNHPKELLLIAIPPKLGLTAIYSYHSYFDSKPL